MPAFKYEALDANGKSSNGIVEAESAKAARTHLRGLQLVPLGLTPVAVVESAEKRSLFARKTFSSSGLAVWTRQLAGLFFFSSRRRHTMWNCDWSSDVSLPI